MVPAFHEVAADPAGEVWRHAEGLRRSGMADLVGELSKKATRTKGLSKKHAADLFVRPSGPGALSDARPRMRLGRLRMVEVGRAGDPSRPLRHPNLPSSYFFKGK